VALLTTRLLFVERVGDEVHLDVVVLGRADTPASPPVGEPMCFAFALSDDDAIERLLRRWADAMRVVEIDLCRRRGKDLVRLAVADASLTLVPARS